MMQGSWLIKLQESKLREKWQRQETRHMRNCMKNWKQRRGNEVFEIAKQRNRQSKDVQQVRVIKSKTGEILMEEKVTRRGRSISTTYSTMKTLGKEEKQEQKGEKGTWKISLEKKSGLG